MDHPSPHVLLGKFDEVRTDRVTHSAGTTVQHEPDRIRFIETHLNEVIGGSPGTGRSEADKLVLAAIMPQPMSTPTAAGITARSVGMTLPTLDPLPT